MEPPDSSVDLSPSRGKLLRERLKSLAYLALTCTNRAEIGRSILRGRGPRRLVLSDGTQLEAPDNYMLATLAREIFHERAYTPAGFSIERNDLVVDIGAGVGEFTILASGLTSNNVYAFEPFPTNFTYLQCNIRSNALSNVTIENAAVSASKGKAKLFITRTNVGHLLFDHDDIGHLNEYIEVQTVTLESILEEKGLKHIDFLKLDCEGSEGAIFTSTPIDRLRQVSKIAMEFHDHVSDLRHQQIVSLLKDAGFTTRVDWDGTSPVGYLYAKNSLRR